MYNEPPEIPCIFAAASSTLYYHFEPIFYVNFRQSEVFLNCNIQLENNALIG